ncbi:sodium/glutamate symporter [Pseudomonas sp. ABC1]|uniref:sodium/glutamate symporter n=1 Tax=Pseudomonas sp. ABC1 TaxID=2748080 RepID=UPI00211A9301|nr:sodium/glutamate symporter [Pseudomonas sp. ABC1]
MLLFAGKILTLRTELLRRYSIPEPVIGGFICAAVVAFAYYVLDTQIQFELQVRDLLMLYFFAGIGLKADLRTLLQGGRPLLVLLLLASLFIIMQNLLGMSVASVFGLAPQAGLMAGSISLTGGVGTTLAWAPQFVERLGIANAMELGIASNTLGLIAACVIGGPIARYLMQRHGLQPSDNTHLDIGRAYEEEQPKLTYYGVLWAWMGLNVALLLGQGIAEALESAGLNLPRFVSCLLAGILIRNLLPYLLGRKLARNWPGAQQGLALISDICLGMFLTMALMSLRLWELQSVFFFILVAIGLQLVLCIAYILLVVFRFMGKDYEAAVICAGFGGISLGSTATAVVNMTAVTQQYGAAHRAFILVPLVCGFFIDLVNALVIHFFAGF